MPYSDGCCVCFEVKFDADCSAISLVFEDLLPIHDYDFYEGPYHVIPTVVDQSLSTQNKAMAHDVTVEKVPYIEADNPDGGKTITIAYL